MFDELPIVAINVIDQCEAHPSPPADNPEGAAVVAEPRPEDARAVEAVFAQEEEHPTAAALIGLHASAMMLSELAIRTFEREEAEEALQPRGKPEEEDEE